jgi:pimeloyl-ACP methyl ester carboxylesterase
MTGGWATASLVVCGGLDPLLTVTSQRQLLRAVPDATFEVLPGAGHAIELEQPVAAAARVVAFTQATAR